MRRGSGHKRNKWGPGITKQQEVNVCILYIYDSDKLDSDILLTHRQPLPYALFRLPLTPRWSRHSHVELASFSMSANASGTRSDDLSRIYACM